MEQHPIPRQITTFEFKLIGFLTVKQFIYLIIFIPIGFIVYELFPIPLLNILLGVLTGAVGFALAFLPINDRPMDVWIRNFFKRLTSPTQYLYHKSNHPLYFLQNLYFTSDPHRIMTHIESREKLGRYLASKGIIQTTNTKKQSVSNLFQMSSSSLGKQKNQQQPQNIQGKPIVASSPTPNQYERDSGLLRTDPPAGGSSAGPKHPYFTGIVKNHKLIPLPGILIYVKDEKGDVVRLLKTNPHGIFATFNPLPPATYDFETRDPNNSYLFDTMKMRVESNNLKPIEIFSKELL